MTTRKRNRKAAQRGAYSTPKRLRQDTPRPLLQLQKLLENFPSELFIKITAGSVLLSVDGGAQVHHKNEECAIQAAWDAVSLKVRKAICKTECELEELFYLLRLCSPAPAPVIALTVEQAQLMSIPALEKQSRWVLLHLAEEAGINSQKLRLCSTNEIAAAVFTALHTKQPGPVEQSQS